MRTGLDVPLGGRRTLSTVGRLAAGLMLLVALVGAAASSMAVLGGASLIGTVVLARRGDDARSSGCVAATSPALAPVAWVDRGGMLLVSRAVARPRVSAICLEPSLPAPMVPESLAALLARRAEQTREAVAA